MKHLYTAINTAMASSSHRTTHIFIRYVLIKATILNTDKHAPFHAKENGKKLTFNTYTHDHAHIQFIIASLGLLRLCYLFLQK